MNQRTVFEQEYARLNPAQKQAVDTIEGPVLVIAGPGTGKTQVLTMRIAQILNVAQVNPYNILALTFTDSAAVTMRKRLLELIGPASYYVNICTFHSFCNDLILEFPEKFMFARTLAMLDDLSRIKVIQRAIDAVKPEALSIFHDPYFYQKAILDNIRKLKQENISYSRFAEIIEQDQGEFDSADDKINPKTNKLKGKYEDAKKRIEKNRELLELYKAYNSLLAKEGLYDFEDMILFVIERLQKDDHLLATLRERYLYIHVDEYQDTNGAQNQILQILGSFDRKPNIFAVGDDDQSIYRFQGASLENIMHFEQMFDAEKIIIKTNYRSTQPIIDAASSVIKNNVKRLKEEKGETVELVAAPDPAGKSAAAALPRYIEMYTPDQEYDVIAQNILKLHEADTAFGDIAVLYRRHRDADNLIPILDKYEIPYQLHSDKNILNNIKVQQLLDLLRVINNPEHDPALFRLFLFSFIPISRLDAYKLTKKAKSTSRQAFELMDDTAEMKKRGIGDPEAVKTLKDQILTWREYHENLSFIQFIEKVIQESGLMEEILKIQDTEELNQLKTFFEFARTANALQPKLTIASFLSDIELLEENKLSIKENPLVLDQDSIHLMTVHRAKGQEFEQVFMMHLYDKNWTDHRVNELIKLPPGIVSTVDTDNKEEEERRLFFVAMTRAKKGLTLTCAKQYPTQFTLRETVPSRYIAEMEDELYIKETMEPTDDEQTLLLQKIFHTMKELDYSEAEKDFLRALVEKFSLSVTALNNYITCPRMFKYQNLLRIPRTIEGERDQDKVLFLGQSTHYALEQFFREIQNDKPAPDCSFLLEQFEIALKKELIGTGAYEATLDEGKKILTDYYENYSGSWIKPAALEYGFYGVYMDDVPLTGKIDKIEFVDEGERTVKVIDYKTSVPHSRNTILGQTQYSEGNEYRQLVFYKLLSEVDKRFTFRFSNVVACELEYLKPTKAGIYKKEAFEIPSQDVQDLKEQIRVNMDRIRNLQFQKIADIGVCQKCPFQKICWGKEL